MRASALVFGMTDERVRRLEILRTKGPEGLDSMCQIVHKLTKNNVQALQRQAGFFARTVFRWKHTYSPKVGIAYTEKIW